MMIGVATTVIVGIICIILGATNIKGNISSIHTYHRYRVKEEDKLPFGKLMGIGTIIVGIGIILQGIAILLSDLLKNEVFTLIGLSFLFLSIIAGLIICVYAMKKYNGGIF